MSAKILIADDEAFIRLLILQTLEELEFQGVALLTADNGADALAIIQVEKPEMVFLDVMMPKLSGFEVCQMVKRDPQLQHIFVVVLTAKGQEYDRLHSQEVGADVFITKPFDPDILVRLAQDVLKLP
jgi:two-component system, OmpR family, alkaline phosphatase synthesis response regulator PhoP